MAETHAIVQDQTQGNQRKLVLAGGIVLMLLVAMGAWALCATEFRYSSQEILNRQREIEQLRLNSLHEAVHVWRDRLRERVRLLSTAEMLRLFAMDAQAQSQEALAALRQEHAVQQSDEGLQALAEQASYLRGLLQDLAQRNHWQQICVLHPNGQTLVQSGDTLPLGPMQEKLVRKAAAERKLVYGPVYSHNGELVLNVADPLLPVMDTGQGQVVGVLLVTVPMQQTLQTLLTGQADGVRPCIIDLAGMAPSLMVMDGQRVFSRHLAGDPAQQLQLAFGRRPSPESPGQEVYALGGKLDSPHWILMLEIPAARVDSLLQEEKNKIYGLGVLGGIGIILLLALILASLISRSHKATARRFQRLYALIRQQKVMLDSINASLQVGLLLTDGDGRIVVCNPAFCRMIDSAEETLLYSNLFTVLPADTAKVLQEGMGRATRMHEDLYSLEVSLPAPDREEMRLYRVSLFPFTGQAHTGEDVQGGCVSIFQDITEFRRRAEAARERQNSTMLALVRAIESVDSNLVGHSQKMERVINLLAQDMQLPEQERETLSLAARLSQAGKIFVPHHLLSKREKLSPEEQAEVLRAPEYAFKVLSGMQFGLPVPEAVYEMGERVDGTGLPRGLKGQEISQNARILAVVNAFCAMVSARSYRKSMSCEAALQLLANDPGFDPLVVKALAHVPVSALQEAVAETDSRLG
ncbi:MAG: PAS domain-containing protein [Desulfovibrio sp.]|nr:PAS domain-containing protein [Desulfovibrio sp.]